MSKSYKFKHLVKYDNALNSLPLGKLTSREKDLFFSICLKAKNQGTNIIEITYDELSKMSNYTTRNKDAMFNDLIEAYDKLKSLDIKYEKNGKFIGVPFNMFEIYVVDSNNEKLTIQVSEHFKYILNGWELGFFTTFELKEFVTLRGKYTRDLYRLLKQYKSTGLYIVKVKEFRELLDIPKSFKMSKIDSRVLTPSIDELKPYFEDLKVEKIKAKKGNKIETLKFTFKKQRNSKVIDADYQEHDEELMRYIEENTAKG